jgi:hypothetical protein
MRARNMHAGAIGRTETARLGHGETSFHLRPVILKKPRKRWTDGLAVLANLFLNRGTIDSTQYYFFRIDRNSDGSRPYTFVFTAFICSEHSHNLCAIFVGGLNDVPTGRAAARWRLAAKFQDAKKTLSASRQG